MSSTNKSAKRSRFRIDWGNPVTWMLGGLLVAVIGGLIAGTAGDEYEDGNPLTTVGGIVFFIGAFTWAIRKGMKSSRRD
ncbi:hypothetical protein [Nocardioides sp. SYSU DS0663]|uniref:hypothetical protein n=1 Tax=Nocardioides sp. SYSU DS0663 TaxID=3416445 RepID=UPI003F4B0EFE